MSHEEKSGAGTNAAPELIPKQQRVEPIRPDKRRKASAPMADIPAQITPLLGSSGDISGQGARLTDRQEQAIAALIGAPSIAEAARTCGVSEKTLDRWLHHPEFAAAYAAARQQTLQAALQSLEAACTGAVTALVRVMNGETTPTAQVVSAARSVLNYAMRGKELMELEDRIAAIEATLGGHKREPEGAFAADRAAG